MAEPYLSASTNSYGAINVAQSGEQQSTRHPLVVLYHEVRSGRQRIGPVILYSLIAAIGAAQNGFMLGFTSVLSINIQKHHYPSVDTQNLQYIGSISTIGALIAGLITGYISDKFGRKMSLLLASIPYAIGFFVITLSYSFIERTGNCSSKSSHDCLVDSGNQLLYFVFFLIGRALSGFGAGALSLVVPVYLAEISPTDLRGLFGSLNQLFVTIGILVVYFLNTFLEYYITCLVVMSITVFFVSGVLILPRSPRWLVANNNNLDASAVLYQLRGPKADIQKELRTLQKVVESQVAIWHKLAMFKRPPVFVPMIFSLVLMFFQQFCGINVIIFYAGNVLQDADVKNPDLSADFGVGIIQVIATFVSVMLVDILGRKILLIVGGSLLALSTGGLGAYFLLHQHFCHNHISDAHPYCHSEFGYFAVAMLALFIIGFSIGWGPIPWLMMTELAPLQVRGIMSGVATAVNWGFAAIITAGFNEYKSAVQPYGAWWTFCGISALSIVFTLIFLPETKGKDLEDIEEYFNKKYGSVLCLGSYEAIDKDEDEDGEEQIK